MSTYVSSWAPGENSIPRKSRIQARATHDLWGVLDLGLHANGHTKVLGLLRYPGGTRSLNFVVDYVMSRKTFLWYFITCMCPLTLFLPLCMYTKKWWCQSLKGQTSRAFKLIVPAGSLNLALSHRHATVVLFQSFPRSSPPATIFQQE